MTNVELGSHLQLWTTAPFALLLLAIAVLPLTAARWFGTNRNKAIVSALFSLPVIAYLMLRFGGSALHQLAATGEDYVSFIILLLALFTISGGVYLTGNLLGTPRTNLLFLLVGAVLANLIGTMGASMILIRPLLRANSERRHVKHVVVFFIFAVSNIGGMLTPLGDPPLFLGFLRGVPFSWTFRLWPQWMLAVGLTLAAFWLFEKYYYGRETSERKRWDCTDRVPIRIAGKLNLALLLTVIGVVLISGPLARTGEQLHIPFLREALLISITLLSLKFGGASPRAANHFNWEPMIEVAVLFAGIFAAMIPALAMLEANGAAIGVAQPWQYSWAAGGLSAFLDNSPTYLALASAAQGQLGATTISALASTQVIAGQAFSHADFLAAVSFGAITMGAGSYIGNAPNLAVKAIAESSGVKMPSFLGYLGYSATILLPIFLIVTVVFFR
jgi:Na+/H+ antiporter NhaD/arsenite permease-like protein